MEIRLLVVLAAVVCCAFASTDTESIGNESRGRALHRFANRRKDTLQQAQDSQGGLSLTDRLFKRRNNKVASQKLQEPTTLPPSSGNDTGNGQREGRFLSLFTLIQFNNDPCTTTNGDNGTCYTAAQCSAAAGTSGGPCAQGFGVCCIFTKTCGETVSQNNSYFTNLNYPSTYDATGSCQLTVQKSMANVCQLRLDFFTLTLNQPEGNDSVCSRDQLIITGGSRVPAICGTNTGQHMYVEMDQSSNSPITMTVVTSGPSFARQWRVKITQITCDSSYRADSNCLQYYTGVSGTIRTFNYDGVSGRQLSNQDYTICIRTERNFCGIQYSTCTGGLFSITGPTGATATTAGTPIGAQVGSTSCVTDWITIPCASDNGRAVQTGGSSCQDRICGDVFASIAGQNPLPVFSTVRPFRVVVHFDGVEATGTPAQFNNRGFCLNYVQQPCTA